MDQDPNQQLPKLANHSTNLTETQLEENHLPFPQNKIATWIEETKVFVSDAQFLDDRTLSLKLNDHTYTYKLSRAEYKNKSYFTCINRYKGDKAKLKCLAKAHYDLKNKKVEVMSLHNPNCGPIKQLDVNLDYFSQKDDIINSLSQNDSLGVTSTMNMLRNKNVLASPKSKRKPLKYVQVKKIIKDYKQENNINSQIPLDNPDFLKTIDGAIFRRCHNKYDLFNKSNINFKNC